MNYNKIYYQIIDRAKSVVRKGYLEKHHIIPKCMGGSNDVDNIVSLTAREHYICHWLLAKQHNIKKLWAAFAMMSVGSNKHERIKNSKFFERSRKARSIAFQGEGNPQYGKPSYCKSHTIETKEKIRNSKLGKKRKPFKKNPLSQEAKDNISKSLKGRVAHNKGITAEKIQCEYCKKIIGGKANYSRWHGEKCKSKILEAL